MSASVTLGTMLTEVRRRSNQETSDQANAFVTDAEIRALLNTYLAELYDLLVENRGADYYRAIQNIPTVGGVTSYSLPGDFYKLISVDLTVQPGDVRPMRPYTEAERDRFRWIGSSWRSWDPLYYQLQAGNLAVIPTPAGGMTITVNYVPAFVPFLTDGTQDNGVFDGVNGWQDFAIWGACAAIAAKDEGDPSFAAAQQAVWRARITALAESRDLGEPPQVQKVRNRRMWR